MIGFQLRGTSPSYKSFSETMSCWTEGEIWLKHALGLPAPDGADAIVNIQNEAITGIEKQLSKLKSTYCNNIDSHLYNSHIIVDIFIAKEKAFTAKVDGINGKKNLAQGFAKFGLGTNVCIYVCKLIFRFDGWLTDHGHDDQKIARLKINVDL